ncbi:general transcription factor II-I repeat domain-containing protein 2B-like [Aphis craccivora]|uniref:General transcription factor II-I repeat domain-containing protein 2B-like n=1 Tax=Aphis craccivora TaxID=307492 RepID=A0A6G0Z2C7_APHCR|nr:general transcription factor II-I repeat domain-containing protein 2B-like [Aphis craccivora]
MEVFSNLVRLGCVPDFYKFVPVRYVETFKLACKIISMLSNTYQCVIYIKSDCVIIFLLKLKSWWEKRDCKYFWRIKGSGQQRVNSIKIKLEIQLTRSKLKGLIKENVVFEKKIPIKKIFSIRNHLTIKTILA